MANEHNIKVILLSNSIQYRHSRRYCAQHGRCKRQESQKIYEKRYTRCVSEKKVGKILKLLISDDFSELLLKTKMENSKLQQYLTLHW